MNHPKPFRAKRLLRLAALGAIVPVALLSSGCITISTPQAGQVSDITLDPRRTSDGAAADLGRPVTVYVMADLDAGRAPSTKFFSKKVSVQRAPDGTWRAQVTMPANLCQFTDDGRMPASVLVQVSWSNQSVESSYKEVAAGMRCRGSSMVQMLMRAT